MIAEIGSYSILVSFIASLYGIVSALYGERTKQIHFVISARNAVMIACGMLLVATGLLEYALITEHYEIRYIWSVSSPHMPLFYRVTAIWGSQAGSMLFWSCLMSVFSAIAIWFNWRNYRRLMPYAIVYMLAVLAFFVGLVLFIENPFERWWIQPDAPEGHQVISQVLMPDGAYAPTQDRLAATAKGLSPMLRHFGMAIHPPFLYLGFVGFIIPYAFAMSALASGDLSSNWIKAGRRWTLASWLFLSLGLMLGGRWAYDVLGWGGYWGWDPVENAAFLPWLMGTGFLHSVIIQEKRGMLKTWNMFLAITTFSAVIFGTFATRSGLVDSVHSFAQSPIGFPMFFFWFILTLVSAVLILYRRNQGLLAGEHVFRSLLSRESLFVLNNLIFVALFVAVAWGSFGAPIISELVFDTKTTYSTEYYEQITPWLFLAMYLLMGVAPLSAWGATSIKRLGRSMLVPFALTLITMSSFFLLDMTSVGALLGYGLVTLAGWVAIYETYRAYSARRQAHQQPRLRTLLALVTRNPRRYGGYMVHLGIVVIGIGIIGSTLYQTETQQTLIRGESLYIDGYEMRYDYLDSNVITQDGRVMDIAHVTVLKNGRAIASLEPRRDYFMSDDGTTMTIAGAHSTLENDFYVLLVGWEEISEQSATFKVYINPLINLIWWGGIILVIGTIIATLPSRVLPTRVRQEMRKRKLGDTQAKG